MRRINTCRFRWPCVTLNPGFKVTVYLQVIYLKNGKGSLTVGHVGYLRHQQQVDLWPFDLESGVRDTCDVGYLCANFSLPGLLCSRVRPYVRDRQSQTSDRRQTKACHPLWGRRHNKATHHATAFYNFKNISRLAWAPGRIMRSWTGTLWWSVSARWKSLYHALLSALQPLETSCFLPVPADFSAFCVTTCGRVEQFSRAPSILSAIVVAYHQVKFEQRQFVASPHRSDFMDILRRLIIVVPCYVKTGTAVRPTDIPYPVSCSGLYHVT